MGRLKHRLSFYGITLSAYISPLLMIMALATSHWLSSTEKLTQQMLMRATVTTTPPPGAQTSTVARKQPIFNSNTNQLSSSGGGAFSISSGAITSTVRSAKHGESHTKSTSPHAKPLEFIEATYGLWEMCKIKDTSRKKYCEYVKHFQSSDSEATVTDTLKKQISSCLIPILLALTIMLTSCILHTYAYFRKKSHYLFLLSGCLFIFAGLASLTGLIVFIAAVNGAVDNKLTLSKTKEEAPFNYNYGFSFFFAVLSFLTQELNGICNIYWYVDYYRKYKYDRGTSTSKSVRETPAAPAVPVPFQIPTIKVNDMAASDEHRNSRTARSSINSTLSGSKDRKQSSGSSSCGVAPPVSIGFFAARPTGIRTPNDLRSSNKQNVVTTDENSSLFERSGADDELSLDSASRHIRRPTTNRIHKLNHQLYKLNMRRDREASESAASLSQLQQQSSQANQAKESVTTTKPTTSGDKQQTSLQDQTPTDTDIMMKRFSGSDYNHHPSQSKYTVLKVNNSSQPQQSAANKSVSSTVSQQQGSGTAASNATTNLKSVMLAPPLPQRRAEISSTSATTASSEDTTTAISSPSSPSSSASSTSSSSSSSSSSTSSSSTSTDTSTHTPSSPTLSSSNDSNAADVKAAATTSTVVNNSQAQILLASRKLLQQQDNLPRVRKSAHKQLSFENEENELKARFYKLCGEPSTRSPKQTTSKTKTTTSTSAASGGSSSAYQIYHQPPANHLYIHHHSQHKNHPTYYSHESQSGRYPHSAAQQHQQHHISSSSHMQPQLKKGSVGSQQRQRQDWFRRAPEIYAQSYDTSLSYKYHKNRDNNNNNNNGSTAVRKKRTSGHVKQQQPSEKENKAGDIEYNEEEEADDNENDDDERTIVGSSRLIYGDGLNVMDEPSYYPKQMPQPWPNANPNQLAAVLSAAEVATFDYQKKAALPITYNEFVPSTSWPERCRVYEDQFETSPSRRRFEIANYDKAMSKSLIDQSQVQYWWSDYRTPQLVVSEEPYHPRASSRRDHYKARFVKNIRGTGVSFGTATATNTSTATASSDNNRNQSLADYRPVTKYIIEDEDAANYLNMLSTTEGGFVPIFGGSLKRTTSV